MSINSSILLISSLLDSGRICSIFCMYFTGTLEWEGKDTTRVNRRQRLHRYCGTVRKSMEMIGCPEYTVIIKEVER